MVITTPEMIYFFKNLLCTNIFQRLDIFLLVINSYNKVFYYVA